MALSKAGADRQEIHEGLRQHAITAWESVQKGEENPLIERVAGDPDFLRYISADTLRSLMDASNHVGDAPERAKSFANQIRETVKIRT
jgi:adenylosuccinate lyase